MENTSSGLMNNEELGLLCNKLDETSKMLKSKGFADAANLMMTAKIALSRERERSNDEVQLWKDRCLAASERCITFEGVFSQIRNLIPEPGNYTSVE